MNRRQFILSSFTAFLASFILPRLAFPESTKKFRLAFGSCAQQNDPQPIWNTIQAQTPDAFAFLGDNVYGDTTHMGKLRAQYEKLAAKPEFAAFRKAVPLVATWDDHDYGRNDAGSEYPRKEGSKALFLEFFQEPKDSPRRQRDGVYTSYVWGEEGERVQLILLDLRWFRTSPLKRDGQDHYIPNPDPAATLLGEAQWRWLEGELARPADVRILASSIQLVASDHRWEKWGNLPLEKERLFTLLDRMEIKNLVVISGDMHFAELSKEHTPAGTPIYDLTCSGLNFYEWAIDPNGKRVALFDQGAHFGMVTVDWSKPAPEVTLEAIDLNGTAQIRQRLTLPASEA